MDNGPYTIQVKNEKLTQYNRLGLFILLIHGFYFILYFIKTPSGVNYLALAGGILCAALGVVLNGSTAFREKKPVIPFAILYLVLSMAWFLLLNGWLGAALILLAILDQLVRKKPVFLFTREKIGLPFLTRSSARWEVLNQVILKDGILTLDFSNDHLFQAEVVETGTAIDEKVFNEFCRSCLPDKD
ncbi:MAG: hypothetical protein IPP31_10760 [Chitinophagaceae bacterium]|nr:hypothetical protein [Chitinophagaceae bacterium]